MFELAYRGWRVGADTLDATERVTVWAGRPGYESAVTIGGAPLARELATGLVTLRADTVRTLDVGSGYGALAVVGGSENEDRLALGLLYPRVRATGVGTAPRAADGAEGVTDTEYVRLRAAPGDPVPFAVVAGWEGGDAASATLPGLQRALADWAERLAHPVAARVVAPGATASGAVVGAACEGAPLDALVERSLARAAALYRRAAPTYSPADGFLRSTDEDGRWETLPAWRWTSGFFPGTLWYLYEATGDPALRAQAERWTAALGPVPAPGGAGPPGIFEQTGDEPSRLGFQAMPAYGHAHRLTGADAEPVLEAARMTAERFDPDVGALKSWDTAGWGDVRETWDFPVIVDGMMNLELLFWAARNGGDPALADVAAAHARATARTLVRPDGSTFHVAEFDPETGALQQQMTWQGLADSSTWARGRRGRSTGSGRRTGRRRTRRSWRPPCGRPTCSSTGWRRVARATSRRGTSTRRRAPSATRRPGPWPRRACSSCRGWRPSPPPPATASPPSGSSARSPRPRSPRRATRSSSTRSATTTGRTRAGRSTPGSSTPTTTSSRRSLRLRRLTRDEAAGERSFLPGPAERGPAFAPLAAPTAADVLARPLAPHPRLFLTPERLGRVESARTGRTADWRDALLDRADRYLSDGWTPRYEKPDGLRFDFQGELTRRVEALGLAYQLRQDERYAREALRLLDAVAAMPDWNPQHFLEVAEITRAVAVGYDWLHDALSDDERQRLRAAIVRNGLEPALRAYRGQAPHQESYFTVKENNWSPVSNGGIAVGALAVLDEEPEAAAEALAHGLRLVPGALRHYAPDGGWDEGPSYWHYATEYAVILMDALQTALGTDFGLSGVPGFAETAAFPLHLTGPTGLAFNYGDANSTDAVTTRLVSTPETLWLARLAGRPAWAAPQLATTDPAALDLLWDGPDLDAGAAPLPLDRFFRGVDVAAMRSAWGDPAAVFVAAKGGKTTPYRHSTLDAGTFVLDALGERWAVDLGKDDYNLPGYFDFDGRRWDFYRNRAEGQNALVLAPAPGQDPAGPDLTLGRIAPLVASASRPGEAHAVFDLTPVYAPRAARVRRGVRLFDGRSRVLVQDEVEGGAGGAWQMHTRAEVEVAADGRSATLRQNGRQLHAALVAPAGVRFEVRPARPAEGSPTVAGQSSNEGVVKLVAPVPTGGGRLAVVFTPLTGEQGAPAPPALTPLGDWR